MHRIFSPLDATPSARLDFRTIKIANVFTGSSMRFYSSPFSPRDLKLPSNGMGRGQKPEIQIILTENQKRTRFPKKDRS